MNFSGVLGKDSSAGGEEAYLSAVNGSGAAIALGSALCFSHTASDGRTVVLPVGAAASNLLMFAGVAQDTIGTGEYSSKIKRMGVATALVSGAADVVPGAHLLMANGTPALQVGTSGLFGGTMLTSQGKKITCLGTVTAGQGFITTRVYIGF